MPHTFARSCTADHLSEEQGNSFPPALLINITFSTHFPTAADVAAPGGRRKRPGRPLLLKSFAERCLGCGCSRLVRG